MEMKLKIRITLLLTIVLILVSCNQQEHSITNEAWSKVPQILDEISAPVFPDREYNVIDFGAVPNREMNSRKAIQAAVDTCSSNGGGKVIVPNGEYFLNGPLHLKSNVNLHLAEGSVIFFGTNPEDYLPIVEVRWEGTRCLNYSPFIYAYREKNIAITGKGTIDGQQDKFWILWKLIQDKNKVRLRTMGKNLVPLEERVFGKGHFLRPTLIEPYQCENVLIEGVTVKNSPFWTIHPVFCNNVIIRNVNIQPGQSNDDGIDPESCSYVLIENNDFYTEDDNIAIKAGRDNDAWIENGGQPTENVIIRNNIFHHCNAGAISIGSEMSGGVRNIFTENNVMKNVGRPFCIKSNTDRGGVVENIYHRNTKVDTCTEFVRIRLDYKGADAGKYPADFRNFFFENIEINFAGLGIHSLGLPEKEIENLFFNDIKIKELKKTTEIYFTKNVQLQNFDYNKITANENEYYTQSRGGEEDPDRIYWEDLPAPVRDSFLRILNKEIDKIKNVDAVYKNEVKAAFAENPMINNISTYMKNNKKVYRLQKFFGWTAIDVHIERNGNILDN